MSLAQQSPARGARQKAVSSALYAAIVVALLGVAVAAASSLLDGVNAVNAANEVLGRMDHRKGAQPENGGDGKSEASGSPFLEGQTVTIAGAALQQRVGAAVQKAGGNVLSTQIDLQGPNAAQGFVGLSTNFEIPQPALQPLLYDLEAGMPYLFIDSLAIQTPQAAGEAEGAKMRVQIGVSGKWQAAK